MRKLGACMCYMRKQIKDKHFVALDYFTTQDYQYIKKIYNKIKKCILIVI